MRWFEDKVEAFNPDVEAELTKACMEEMEKNAMCYSADAVETWEDVESIGSEKDASERHAAKLMGKSDEEEESEDEEKEEEEEEEEKPMAKADYSQCKTAIDFLNTLSKALTESPKEESIEKSANGGELIAVEAIGSAAAPKAAESSEEEKVEEKDIEAEGTKIDAMAGGEEIKKSKKQELIDNIMALVKKPKPTLDDLIVKSIDEANNLHFQDMANKPSVVAPWSKKR